MSSSGTTGYHVGDKPDHRSIFVAQESGYKGIEQQRARRLSEDDYKSCDLLLALDASHYRFMMSNAGANKHKIRYCQQFANFTSSSSSLATTTGGAGGGAGSASSGSTGAGATATHATVKTVIQLPTTATTTAGGGLDVPDPYYDDLDAFRDVLRMLEKSTDGLIAAVKLAVQSEDPAGSLLKCVPQL